MIRGGIVLGRGYEIANRDPSVLSARISAFGSICPASARKLPIRFAASRFISGMMCVYRGLFVPHLKRIVTEKSSPFLEITEHPVASDVCEIVTLSYSNTTETFEITISSAWQVSETAVGNVTRSDKKLLLAPENGLCRFTVKKMKQ